MRQNDPYADLGVYEKIDVDPYADLGVVEIAPKPRRVKKERQGMDKATQVAGVTTGALLPYATAAGAGAAAGAPFAGVGAIPGAAGGVLALGVGDLGTGLYNMAAPLFGGGRVPLPSETIRQGYETVGIGRRPETAGEQVYSDVLEAGASGFGQAKAFQNLADVAVSPQSRNMMAALGQNARAQTLSSAAAGGAPSVASNYFDVTNPLALAGLSLAGGSGVLKAAAPKTTAIPAAKLQDQASDLYARMKQENVNIASQAMGDLESAARKRIAAMNYDPDTDKLVTEALDLFGKKAGQPISFNMLDKFRRAVRDLPYSEAGGKRGTSEQRAMVKALDDVIDDFMNNLSPTQTTAGDAGAAAQYLTKARDVRAKAFQTETLENAATAATDRAKQGDSPKGFAGALRSEYQKIVNNPRKMGKFDPQTRAAIKQVANGTATRNTFAALGRLAPSMKLFGVQMPFLGVGATYSPGTAATIAGLQGVGAASRGVANRMTRAAANKALVSASGGIKPGGPGFFALSPTAQQNVLAQDRAKKAEERRRLGF